MKDIVIAGCAITDVIKEVDQFPQPTSLAKVRKQKQSVGGAMCNTSIDLKKLNEKRNIKVIGVVGNDSNGDFVLNTLKEKGLDISSMFRVNAPTSYTDVISEASGRRTFFHNQGADDYLSEEHFANVNADNTELIHIGYLLLLGGLDEEDSVYGTKMAKLLHSLQSRNVKTSIDIVSEDSERFMKVVTPSLKYCNYAIMNEFEGGKITNINPRNDDETINIENIKKILIKLKELGVQDKVIIHCPELGAVIDKNLHITVVPSLKLPKGYIKGSVGAGDAFAAGCLHGIVNQYDDEHMLRLASCCSALNLSVIDSTSGANSEEVAMVLDEQYERLSL